MENFKLVRENLIDMLEDLDERLGKITDNENHLKKSSSNDCEEQVMAEDEEENKEVEKIQQAISRIDKGTYGICLTCGQPIKQDRLDAIPFSSHCTHCTDKKDQSNGNLTK